jgi:hypothetical protein
MNIHPNARTTPKMSAEIKASGLSRKQGAPLKTQWEGRGCEK